jgi:hypothetical protein
MSEALIVWIVWLADVCRKDRIGRSVEQNCDGYFGPLLVLVRDFLLARFDARLAWIISK